MPSEDELPLEIQNVVATTGIDQELDLQSVSLDLPGADYDPHNFPGLIYHTQDPKAAVLIFRSGEIVSTGTKSVDAVHESLEIIFGALADLDIPIPDDPTTTVQNIVSSGDLGTTLNLDSIAIGLGLEAVEYEPEQFPGLVYRLDHPEVVLLLFASGKVVVTGAKEPADARTALEAVHDELDSLGLLG